MVAELIEKLTRRVPYRTRMRVLIVVGTLWAWSFVLLGNLWRQGKYALTLTHRYWRRRVLDPEWYDSFAEEK